jgi:hypothetical protein
MCRRKRERGYCSRIAVSWPRDPNSKAGIRTEAWASPARSNYFPSGGSTVQCGAAAGSRQQSYFWFRIVSGTNDQTCIASKFFLYVF